MTTVIVDSDVVIDWLRKRPEAVDRLRQEISGGADIAASVITRFEVLSGAKPRELSSTVESLGILRWIGIEKRTVDLAAELSRKYSKSHSGINLADYAIAATVIESEATFLTRNIKHYPMLKDLAAAY